VMEAISVFLNGRGIVPLPALATSGDARRLRGVVIGDDAFDGHVVVHSNHRATSSVIRFGRLPRDSALGNHARQSRGDAATPASGVQRPRPGTCCPLIFFHLDVRCYLRPCVTGGDLRGMLSLEKIVAGAKLRGIASPRHGAMLVNETDARGLAPRVLVRLEHAIRHGRAGRIMTKRIAATNRLARTALPPLTTGSREIQVRVVQQHFGASNDMRYRAGRAS
jgi:hypothetical protein